MGARSTISDVVNRLFKRFAGTAEESADTLGHLSGRGSEDEAVAEHARQLQEGAAEADMALRKEAGTQARKGFFKAAKIGRPTRMGMDLMHKAFNGLDRFGKWLFKTITPVKLAVAAGAVAGISALANLSPVDPPPRREIVAPNSGIAVNIDIPSPIPTFPPPPIDLALNASEMERAFAVLGIATGREHVELDVSDLPPPVIAAASAAPLWVSARLGDATYSTTTTVGQAYQALPEEARPQFEEQVRTSSSDDHSIRFKEDFTVTSEFMSITISSR